MSQETHLKNDEIKKYIKKNKFNFGNAIFACMHSLGGFIEDIKNWKDLNCWLKVDR